MPSHASGQSGFRSLLKGWMLALLPLEARPPHPFERVALDIPTHRLQSLAVDTEVLRDHLFRARCLKVEELEEKLRFTFRGFLPERGLELETVWELAKYAPDPKAVLVEVKRR